MVQSIPGNCERNNSSATQLAESGDILLQKIISSMRQIVFYPYQYNQQFCRIAFLNVPGVMLHSGSCTTKKFFHDFKNILISFKNICQYFIPTYANGLNQHTIHNRRGGNNSYS